MLNTGDTIAALATPPGKGGVGIIRVSGPLASSIATQIIGHCPAPRYAEYRPFVDRDGQVIDQGLALFFQNPHSFTGEDVLELQGHGGQIIMDLLLARVLELGARLATAGEFSRRAFLNNKMDLAQAEAVADLINASTVEAAQSAMKSLRGEFSQQIQVLVDEAIYLRMYVESAIDFPEEEIDFLSDGVIEAKAEKLLQQLDQVLALARQGALLQEGMNLVILGQPNAGKSRLLNALAQKNSAIVTNIPGTTRDVLREQIQLDGMPLNIADTAGLRDSGDAVEQEGVRRAWLEVEKADRVLLLVDDALGWNQAYADILSQLPPDKGVTVVFNKIDISGGSQERPLFSGLPALGISADQGLGMDKLKAHLKQVMGFSGAGDGVFMARRRHITCLENARSCIERGLIALKTAAAGEILAEELRLAQQQFNQITGEFDNEDLLGRIFSSFCIGK